MSEPFTAFSFRVEILLPGAAEPLCEAAFAECDGMELQFDVRSLSEGGAGRRLLAGPASTGRVTLERGITASADLWDWCDAVQRDPALRADARVLVLTPDGSGELARFRLRRCLPVRLRAPALDAVAGIVAVEELELACESLTREGPDGAPDPPPLRRAELRELDDSLRKEINKDRWVRVPVNPSDLRVSFLTGDRSARLAVELWLRRRRRARDRAADRVLRREGAAARALRLGRLPLRRARRGARGDARLLLARGAPVARSPLPLAPG